LCLIFEMEPLFGEAHELEMDNAKSHAVNQLINIYHKTKNRKCTYLHFGDELEYMVLALNHFSRSARVKLRSDEILSRIGNDIDGERLNVKVHCEFSNFQLEAIPKYAFGCGIKCLLGVESNMKLRREYIERFLYANEILVTMGGFPRFGAKNFTEPQFKRMFGPILHSPWVPDQLLTPAPRYKAGVKNLLYRRGHPSVEQGPPIIGKIPVYEDLKTDKDMKEIDADITFGSGVCCLQVTIEAQDLEEAKKLHDILVVLSAIMMALTASTPFYAGFVSDWDARWSLEGQVLDDRKPEERGFFQEWDFENMEIGQQVDVNVSDTEVWKKAEVTKIDKESKLITYALVDTAESSVVPFDKTKIFPKGVKTDERWKKEKKRWSGTSSVRYSRKSKEL